MADPKTDTPSMDARFLQKIANDAMATALANGGGGPHDPGMEQRVAKLEETVQGIDKALRELAPSIKSIADGMPKIREDLAEMKGRMTGIDGQIRQLPTMWTLTALVLSIFGLAFVLLRFAVPH